MSTVDFGDYTVTTTITPNGKTETVAWKPGTPGDNKQQLVTKAAAAITANKTFLALASPTNAQVVAQVQRLTRQMDALIRILVTGDFTDISDT